MVTSTPAKVGKADDTSDTDVVSSYFIVTNSTLVELSTEVDVDTAEESPQHTVGGLDREIQQIGQVRLAHIRNRIFSKY